MSPITLRLRQLREEAELSQAALAHAANARQATISNLERGESTRIDFELLDRLCDTLTRKLGRTIGPGDLLERWSRLRR